MSIVQGPFEDCDCPSHHEHGPEGAVGCDACYPQINVTPEIMEASRAQPGDFYHPESPALRIRMLRSIGFDGYEMMVSDYSTEPSHHSVMHIAGDAPGAREFYDFLFKRGWIE
jgi:hypothetical protein